MLSLFCIFLLLHLLSLSTTDAAPQCGRSLYITHVHCLLVFTIIFLVNLQVSSCFPNLDLITLCTQGICKPHPCPHVSLMSRLLNAVFCLKLGCVPHFCNCLLSFSSTLFLGLDSSLAVSSVCCVSSRLRGDSHIRIQHRREDFVHTPRVKGTSDKVADIFICTKVGLHLVYKQRQH